MFHDELMSKEERRQFHDAFARLADAICASLRMLLWALEGVQKAAYADAQNVHAIPLMMIFDFAEPIDGVSVLVRSGSAKNCPQLLRTALEIQLSLRYIMEHKDSYARRVYSYEFYHIRDRLRWALRCDPTSDVGKQLRTELAGDQFAIPFDVQGFDVPGVIKDVEGRINSTRYDDVRTELARMKAAKIRDNNWFSLWDGPKDVRSLAFRLKFGSMYETLYRSYSTATHGSGAARRITGKEGDEVQVDPLRSPNGLPEMCRNACNLCNLLTPFLVDERVPHQRQEMKERYIRDVEPGLQFIESVKVLGG